MKFSSHTALFGKPIDELETPVLLVDLDCMERNLADMAAYCSAHNISLWPHTKTHKSISIAQRQLELGAAGLTVAKSREAEVMAKAGGKRILVAYPIWGDKKWQRLAEFAEDNEITVALDSVETACGLAREARKSGVRFNALVDLDLGMLRTGVSSPLEAVELAKELDGLPELDVQGLFTYYGHVWGRPADQDSALCEMSATVEETLHLFDKAGISRARVSGGSTPTAKASHRIYGQNETRPGTYVFYDRNYTGIDVCSREECALTVLTSVVSCRVPGKAVVDAGSKTMSGDLWLSGDGKGYGWILEHSPEIVFSKMSEEHGHLDILSGAKTLKVGDRLRIIPNHVCTTVNQHDFYLGIRNGVVEKVFFTDARGCVQ
ncbi:MAG: alanine racemase [Chthoniobacterales bacterium]